MRLGVAFVPGANAQYRAIEPMLAMARRGHEIVWPPEGGQLDPRRLAGCDHVHVYRIIGPPARRTLEDLASRGTTVTYDNDDDYTAVPKESPRYKTTGGYVGQRTFAETVKMARLAHAFTTTNSVLAEKYQAAGVDRVEVIGNHLAPDVARPRTSHQGVVVGWVAGMEHLADVARIPIRRALEALLDRHAEVRVHCIGLDLGLAQRYQHEADVPFEELPRRIGGFDIGIAPLADIPVSWARSDIKVKEYAASGVPWLASPIGPYASLGEREGGALVRDDGWFEALDRLVSRGRERKRLGRKASKWARTQTVEAVADRWEQVFGSGGA